MTSYRLNAEQTAVVERVRKVADEQIAPYAADVDAKGRYPREGMDALGRAGFLGLNIPGDKGGMGQGLRVAAAVLDELAQRDASLAMVYKMHLCGCACYVAFPQMGEKYFPQIVAGRHLTTLAWSEQGSRSHFWAPASQATESGGNVVLNAQKSWVTSAGEADGYVVSTRTAGGTGATDTMLYLVLKDDKGMRIAGTWNGLGMRGNASNPMILENCAIPADRALCKKSEGFPTMLGVVLPWFNLGNEAISVGIAEAAVAATTTHLTSRRFSDMNNAPLSDLPTLRARLAQMRIETDTARAHLGSVIDAVEQPGPQTTLMVLESKAVGAEAALRVTDLGMKACGGAAFSRHLSLERNFRDARAGYVMAPTSDVLQEFIGRALCGMPLF
jgi:alkylation response protein AidB-like acyl-CoA dehydrogenase